jgi:hypothetical protein
MNRGIPARLVKGLRSGQTIWGVWGNTADDLYVFSVRVVGKKYWKPETKEGLGGGYWSWKCKRHNDLQRWWRHDDTGLRGTFNDRWFTTQRKAERFLQEIKDGLHLGLMYWWSDRCLQFDLLDESMGINRGLGTYVPPEEMCLDDDEDDEDADLSDEEIEERDYNLR